jgi:hypothetical protein
LEGTVIEKTAMPMPCRPGQAVQWQPAGDMHDSRRGHRENDHRAWQEGRGRCAAQQQQTPETCNRAGRGFCSCQLCCFYFSCCHSESATAQVAMDGAGCREFLEGVIPGAVIQTLGRWSSAPRDVGRRRVLQCIAARILGGLAIRIGPACYFG